MPRRRLSMRQISEVLRLAAQGLSHTRRSPERRHQRVDGAELPGACAASRPELAAARRPGRRWPSRRGCSRAAKRNSDQVGQSPTGSRCTASANAASTSRCSCCISSTRRSIPTAGAIPSSARTTAAGWARQDVVMRLEYAAGERMFVDFCWRHGAGHRPRDG